MSQKSVIFCIFWCSEMFELRSHTCDKVKNVHKLEDIFHNDLVIFEWLALVPTLICVNYEGSTIKIWAGEASTAEKKENGCHLKNIVHIDLTGRITENLLLCRIFWHLCQLSQTYIDECYIGYIKNGSMRTWDHSASWKNWKTIVLSGINIVICGQSSKP